MNYQAKAGQYKKLNIETAGKLELILMCYEKAIEMLRQGKSFLEAGDYEKKARKIQRAIDIIQHLQSCLNFERGGQIARNLDSLYNYAVRRLLEGDIRKNVGAYDEVIKILSELKEAWEGVAKQQEEKARGLAKETPKDFDLQQVAAA